jgi:methyl-accepting chemotaxis protein
MALSNLSIRTKLLGGFLTLVALIAALGVLAVIKLGSVNAHTDGFATDVVPSIHAVGELRDVAGKYRRDQLQVPAALTAKDRLTLPTSPRTPPTSTS